VAKETRWRSWLALLFGFRARVGRLCYDLVGLALALVKYLGRKSSNASNARCQGRGP